MYIDEPVGDRTCAGFESPGSSMAAGDGERVLYANGKRVAGGAGGDEDVAEGTRGLSTRPYRA